MRCVFIACTNPSTVNRSSITIRLRVVDSGDQLAYSDAAELPVGEFRRSAWRSLSPAVTLNTVRSSTAALIACRFGGPVVPLVRI